MSISACGVRGAAAGFRRRANGGRIVFLNRIMVCG